MPFDLSPPRRVSPDCRMCPVQGCLARGADTANQWRAMVGTLPSLMPSGQPLIRAGEPLLNLYSVRAGCIKSCTVDAEGKEHVRAFHFPGDLVGLDALGERVATAQALAVSPSQVCAASVTSVLARLADDPGVSRRLFDQIRRELRLSLALSGDYTADQRVAAFLLYLRRRLGAWDELLRVPMTRRDIGSYLRLATETVCRVLTRFEQKGWLQSQDKRIRLLDLAALQTLAEPVGLIDEEFSLALAA